MMRRRILALSAIPVVVLAIITALWVWLGHPGSSDLERWIGQQIVTVLESHVTPRITFDDLDYQAPRTVVITGLKFTADAHTILSIARAKLELAEIPRTGKPIQIQKVELEAPRVQLITAGDAFAGWSNFIRPDVRQDPKNVPPGRRFSDILVLRHVALRGGEFVYDPGGGGEVMTLPGIDLTLETPPVSDEPGWYALVGTFRREPIFNVDIDGRINLDTVLLEMKRFELKATLGEQQYATLPPAVQQLLRKHQVQGSLSATVAGSIPLNAPEKATGTVQADLQKAHFSMAGTVVPVDRLQVNAALPDGRIEVNLERAAIGTSQQPLLSIRRLSLAMLGLPRGGNPLRIDRLEAEGTRLSVIRDPKGGFVGWNQFADPGSPPTDAGEAMRDITQNLSLGELILRDTGFTYGPGQGRSPLAMDGIDLELRTKPAEDRRLLAWEGTVRREPLLSGQLSGTLDPDGAMLTIERFTTTARVRPDQLGVLPAEARTFITTHGLAGELTVTGRATLPFKKIADTEATLRAEVANGSARIGDVLIPVEKASLDLTLPDGHASISGTGVALKQGDVVFASAKEISGEVPNLLAGGSPFELQRLVLTEPRLQFVRRAGALAGWSNFGRAPATAPSSAATHPAGSDPLPVIARQLKITGAEVTYDAGDGTEPETVSGLDVDLRMQPADRGYAISGGASRKPLADVEIEGTYEHASAMLRLKKLTLHAALNPEQYQALPARMQETLRRRELEGEVSLTFQGDIPLREPRQTSGVLQLDIARGRIAYGDTVWPMRGLHVKATLPDGPLALTGDELEVRSQRRTLLGIRRIRFELPTFPKAGRPVDIRLLELERPSVLLLRAPDGGFVGWNSFFTEGPGSTTGPRQPASTQSVSDVVLLHAMEITNGEVIYDAADGSEPMSLPGIDVTLQMPPGSQEAGWHALRGSIRREPVLRVDFDGRLHADRALLDMKEVKIGGVLGPEQYETLPPRIQQVLREHEVRGRLEAVVRGQVPLHEPRQMDIRVEASLRDGRVALDETVWPVSQLTVAATMGGGKGSVQYDARMLGGQLRGTASTEFAPGSPFRVAWAASGVRMEQTLRIVQQGEPKYSGLINSEGSIRGKAADLPATLSGNAAVNVVEGRLINLPIIRDVMLLASGGLAKAQKASDTAHATFQFHPDRIGVAHLDITSSVVTLRGGGQIFYDGRVEMDINADVLQKIEKTIDKVAGRLNPLRDITGLIGSIGDKVVTYEVRGTVSAPRVRAKPLGLGR